MAVKYFIYSEEQLKFRKQLEGKINKKFMSGIVYVKGVKKAFTELCNTENGSKYTDAKVVASGELSKMKYTLPRSE